MKERNTLTMSQSRTTQRLPKRGCDMEAMTMWPSGPGSGLGRRRRWRILKVTERGF